MKEGRAVGKERVRETKIEGAREWEGNRKREIIAREKTRKIIRDGYAFAHEREREKEGAGDRRGLSPFLHPTLRAPLLDRATSDQPRRRASAPVTEPPRLAVPAKGWIPTEYTDERASEEVWALSRACSSLSYSFQLQGACIPAGQGRVV